MRKFPVILLVVALSTVMFASCSKDDPIGPVEMEEVGKVEVPANSMGFITSKSITDLKGLSGDVAGAVTRGGAAATGGRMAELIRTKMIGTKNLDWMSTTRPLKALVLDPAAFGRPFVMMAPVESKADLMAGLDGVKKNVDGNDVSFVDAGGKTRYINFVGKNAVFTLDAGAFAAAANFVGGDLLKYPATKPLDIQTNSKSLTNVVKPLAGLGMSSIAKKFPQIGMMTTMAVQKVVDFLGGLGRVRIVATFNDGNLVVEASAVPLDGSMMARTAAGAKDRKLTLVSKAPGDGWLEIVGNADPDDTGKTIESLLNSIVSVVGLSGDVKDVYPKVLKDVMTSLSGESLFWVGWDDKFPLRTVVITGLTSTEAAKTASDQMFALLFNEFGKKIRMLAPAPAGGAAPATDLTKLDWGSLEALVKSSTDMMTSSGLSVELKKDEADGTEINHLEFNIDRTRLSASRPDIAKYDNFLGDRLSIGTAFDDGRFYAAAGGDAVKEIKALRGEAAGAAKLAGLVQGAGFDVTWAMRLSLVDAAKVATAGYANLVNALAPGLSTTSISPEISVLSGSRDGRVVVGRLAIPLAGIAELRKPGAAGAAR